MKLRKKKMICILTAFVMAFTVFGCTSLSFAAGENDSSDKSASDELSSMSGRTLQDGQLAVAGEVVSIGENSITVTLEDQSTCTFENVDAALLDGLAAGDGVTIVYSEDAESVQTVIDITKNGLTEPSDDAVVSAMGLEGLQAKGGSNKVDLSWNAVDPADTSHSVYYVLTCPELEGFEDVTTDLSYTKDGLATGTTYTFHIKAYEQLGDTQAPETDTLLDEQDFPPATTTALKAPKAGKSTGAYTSVTLKWGAVSATTSGGKISYEVTGNDSTYKPTKTTLTIKNLSPRGATYTFKVKAVEKDGNGNVIAESSETTIKVKTTDFSTLKLKGLVSDPGYKAVLLEWNQVKGATGYIIYRRQGGERGNIDKWCKDSDGHILKTYKSKKSRGYGIQKKPGAYKKVKTLTGDALAKCIDEKGKVQYRDGGLQELAHTYVYFYQYIIVPYFKDSKGVIYSKNVNGKWEKSNKAYKDYTSKDPNIVKNNTVLPMYVLYKVKYNKPYYKTHKMSDGKKMGRLPKGHYYIGFDKKDGRDRFYMKKKGSSRTEWWFAQKNARVLQGYYLNNGNKNDLSRKDWKTGYSKKTVLDYVNHRKLKSKTNRLIWVSKYAQHAYIFVKNKKTGKWDLINNGKNKVTTSSFGCWSNLCASGKVVFNSRNNNGPIYGKVYVVKRKHHWYYNISKLHPTERLHSVLYKRGKKFGSGKYHDKTLGSPKSNGCIRLKPYTSQFIYKHIPKRTKVLVY